MIMTFDKENSAAGQARSRGPLERISFSKEDSGEKSLLELIEELSTRSSRHGDSADNDRPPLFKDLDDIDGDSRPDLDHMIIRLDGNGF